MPCQRTLCSEAGWALGYVRQDLSARCLGLHFVLNINKSPFPTKIHHLGFPGTESRWPAAMQRVPGVAVAPGHRAWKECVCARTPAHGPCIPQQPHCVPPPAPAHLCQHKLLPGNELGEETSTNEESLGEKYVSTTIRLFCP